MRVDTSAYKNLLQNLSKRLDDGEDIETIRQFIPTELAGWSFLIDSFQEKDDTKNMTMVKIIWIQNLIMNPFNIHQIVSSDSVDVLKMYLLASIERLVEWRVKKQILKILSFLARDIIKYNNECNVFESIVNNDNVFSKVMPETHVYCFLKYLSMIYEFPTKYKETYTAINEDDSSIIQRYKIKIASFQCKRDDVIGTLNRLVSLLNIEDSKLGWTLCKSIFRISKYIDRKIFIKDLIGLLNGEIFCNEQLWINSMTLISFLLLDGTDSTEISFDFVRTAMGYEKEFELRAVAVREASMFLLWSLMRVMVDISEYIHQAVFISFFDMDFNCRRAAVGVIQEFIGRTNNKDEYNKDIDINNSNKNNNKDIDDSINEKITLDDLLLKINYNLVKRRSNCLNLFMKLNDKTPFKDFLLKSLYSFDPETRQISASIISNSYDLFDVPVRYRKTSEKDAVHTLAFFYLKDSRIYEDCINHLCPFINSFIIDQSNFQIRNMKLAIESYLKIASHFDRQTHSKNILFLIIKGFDPMMIYNSSKHLFGDNSVDDFDKKVFDLIKRNNTGIIVNANNRKFRDSVLLRFKNNLKENRSVEFTLQALYLMNHRSIDEIFGLSVGFLYDYTVDYIGDSGYYNRRASLLYFSNVVEQCLSCKNLICNGEMDVTDENIENRNLIECDKMNVKDVVETIDECSLDKLEKTYIRFLADKSKKLRDEIICSLVEIQFNDCADDFSYLKKLHSENSTLKIPVKIRKYHAEFDTFFRVHSELVGKCDNECSFFKALSAAFYKFDDFWIGIVQAYNTGDKKLKVIFENEIFNEENIKRIKAIDSTKFKSQIDLFLLKIDEIVTTE